MVDLVKPNFIGEVPVTYDDEVVGTARMELTRSGYVVAHIDLSDSPVDILQKGFSLGSFTLPKEEK